MSDLQGSNTGVPQLTLSSVVLMAILRLWSGLKYNNQGVIMYDYTYWLPEVLLFSCLEVDFAITCASIPIFWPAMRAAWTQIIVIQEVTVTSEWRGYATDSEKQIERATSLESQKSTDVLFVNRGIDVDLSCTDGEFKKMPPQILRLPQTARTSWGGTPLRI